MCVPVCPLLSWIVTVTCTEHFQCVETHKRLSQRRKSVSAKCCLRKRARLHVLQHKPSIHRNRVHSEVRKAVCRAKRSPFLRHENIFVPKISVHIKILLIDFFFLFSFFHKPHRHPVQQQRDVGSLFNYSFIVTTTHCSSTVSWSGLAHVRTRRPKFSSSST